ncbi:MAG: DUF4358 domain-containing protein [Peptostreptococcaceae bacterium]
MFKINPKTKKILSLTMAVGVVSALAVGCAKKIETSDGSVAPEIEGNNEDALVDENNDEVYDEVFFDANEENALEEDMFQENNLTVGGLEDPVADMGMDMGINEDYLGEEVDMPSLSSELNAVASKLEDSGLLTVMPIMKEHPLLLLEHLIGGNAHNIEDGLAMKAMINVKVQDVFVIKTDMSDIFIEAFENYLEKDLRSFGDGYGGEENIDIVLNAKIGETNGYVYFLATPNADEVEEILVEELNKL